MEYVAQTRGWFYTMFVLGTALFDKPPFQNCICHGLSLGWQAPVCLGVLEVTFRTRGPTPRRDATVRPYSDVDPKRTLNSLP